MTLLTVAQGACQKIGLASPTVFAGSTEREYEELFEIAQEVAEDIARSHEWTLFKTEATVTGDGAAEAFDLPGDYERQLTSTQVWSSSLETPLTHINDENRWLGLEVQSFDFVVNAWIIYGGQIRIKPALASTVTAKYMYQSNLIIQGDSATKAAFTADTDVFRINERLLKLGMIWQWRQTKGLPYAEDMASFERLKARLITADGGSKTLKIGRQRYMPGDVQTAYPQSITVS